MHSNTCALYIIANNVSYCADVITMSSIILHILDTTTALFQNIDYRNLIELTESSMPFLQIQCYFTVCRVYLCILLNTTTTSMNMHYAVKMKKNFSHQLNQFNMKFIFTSKLNIEALLLFMYGKYNTQQIDVLNNDLFNFVQRRQYIYLLRKVLQNEQQAYYI